VPDVRASSAVFCVLGCAAALVVGLVSGCGGSDTPSGEIYNHPEELEDAIESRSELECSSEDPPSTDITGSLGIYCQQTYYTDEEPHNDFVAIDVYPNEESAREALEYAKEANVTNHYVYGPNWHISTEHADVAEQTAELLDAEVYLVTDYIEE
jgi:hypothetical protein